MGQQEKKGHVETKGLNCVIAGNPIISYIALGLTLIKTLSPYIFIL